LVRSRTEPSLRSEGLARLAPPHFLLLSNASPETLEALTSATPKTYSCATTYFSHLYDSGVGTSFPIDECFFGTVKVGDRGQIVIPHEARSALGIQPGDQVMLVRDPKMKGLMVVKVDELQEVITHLTTIMERAKATPVREEE